MSKKKSLAEKIKEYKEQTGYNNFTKEEKEKEYNNVIKSLHAFSESDNQEFMKVLEEINNMTRDEILDDMEAYGIDVSKERERYCSISESLETSLQQMKLMREGKIPKKTWEEFERELEQDDEDNNKERKD